MLLSPGKCGRALSRHTYLQCRCCGTSHALSLTWHLNDIRNRVSVQRSALSCQVWSASGICGCGGFGGIPT
jgi:hypothetical protein